jgi:acetyl esterase/lipase
MKTLHVFILLILCTTLTFAQKKIPHQGLPAGVTLLKDLSYVEKGHARQKLDLYLPEGATEPLPLIIWVHGGAWRSGSKEQCQPFNQGYLIKGYAIASINYRFSQHAIFPAQLEDCKAAIRWLRAHAKDYNLNPARFAAYGGSAGGHLVALLGTTGDIKTFDVGANLDISSKVQAVCDYYGPSDFSYDENTALPEFIKRLNDPQDAVPQLIGGPVKEKRDAALKASPVTYVTTQPLPPFLIVHGDKDTVVPITQSERLFNVLRDAKGNVHLHCIKGAGHGNGCFSAEIDARVLAFFDRWLKKPSPSLPPVAQRTESFAQ